MDSLASIGVVVDPTAAVSGWAQVVAASNTGAAQVVNAVSGMGNTINTNISVIQKAGTQMSTFGEAMRIASASINVIKTAFGALETGFGFVDGFIEAGARVEAFRVQLGGLSGSTSAANDALASLRQFSLTSATSFDSLGQSLEKFYTMSDGMAAVGGNLGTAVKTVEELARAASPDKLDAATDALGRLYGGLLTNVDASRAAKALVETGVASDSLVQKLSLLNKQGASFGTEWDAVTSELDRFAGNSSRYASTFDGLKGMLSNTLDASKAAIGEPLAVALRQPLSDLTAWLGSEQGPAGALGTALGNDVTLF